MLSQQTPSWVRTLETGPRKVNKTQNIIDPPGYVPTSKKSSQKDKNTAPARKPPTVEETDTLKVKKAWEVALGPAKQLPMNAIGMYMSGNSLQIFSIMMVAMLFKGPVQAVFQIQQTFQRFETEGTRDRILLAKIAYVFCNMMLLALGIWKVNGMGLLPTTRSDWLLWEPMREALERSVLLRT